MNDPAPENITGQIVERHTYSHEIEHRIPWGYVTLGVGLMAVSWVLYQSFVAGGPSDSSDDETAESAGEMVEIPFEGAVEGHNQVAGLETQG